MAHYDAIFKNGSIANQDGVHAADIGVRNGRIAALGTLAADTADQITEELRRTKPSMVPHFQFLKSVVKKGIPKFTMPSPAMLHARGDRASISKTYPDPKEFWADLTQEEDRLESPSDWPVAGLLVHAAGQGESGFRVVDVWESEEACNQFGEILAPILQEVGITEQPELYQALTFVSA